MVTEMEIVIETENTLVLIQSGDNEAGHIRLRIGGRGGAGTRYADLTPSQARQIAQFLIAAATEE